MKVNYINWFLPYLRHLTVIPNLCGPQLSEGKDVTGLILKRVRTLSSEGNDGPVKTTPV